MAAEKTLTPSQFKEWIEQLANSLYNSTSMLLALRAEHMVVVHAGEEGVCEMTGMLDEQIAFNQCLLDKLCGRDSVPPAAEQH